MRIGSVIRIVYFLALVLWHSQRKFKPRVIVISGYKNEN